MMMLCRKFTQIVQLTKLVEGYTVQLQAKQQELRLHVAENKDQISDLAAGSTPALSAGFFSV